ncbi:competence protein ComGC, partial [Oenococcus oeni]
MKKIRNVFKRIKNKKQSFTLIEIAIVLFIISLLMLLILPNLNNQRKKAENTQAEAMVSVIQTQVDLYENDNDDKNVTYS